jgi:translation initiation factor 4G
MAPNLTQVAESFGFNESQRDLFLGANLALATGVLSFPLSALLGFLVDSVSSRKRLFAGTLFLTGLSSIATGSSQTYVQLFVSRLICGGFMSGSVSVIFSLLGDLFDAKDRNIASSGLTAMMGAGILFGQVYAGTVGASSGWQQPFLLSGFLCILCAGLVLKIVREPVRGGKEKVLQALLANGTRYDRKLTMDGFVHAMTKNTTNVILMLQGFLTNVPWGIIFTFLNDYLSQEQGLSVPEATFLVFYFGIGSAVGGILGGYLGTIASGISRLSLPLFMALSTFVGIFPFLGLLDLNLRRWPILALMLSFTGGCIANLPAVNVRPCLLNVNPPETRAAAMTTANIMIQIARGSGPSLIILLQRLHGVTRQYSFNLSVSRQLLDQTSCFLQYSVTHFISYIQFPININLFPRSANRLLEPVLRFIIDFIFLSPA